MLVLISIGMLCGAMGSLLAKRNYIKREFYLAEKVNSATEETISQMSKIEASISLKDEEIGVQGMIQDIVNKNIPYKTPKERAMEERLKAEGNK